MRWFYYPHTIDEKTGSETLYKLPKFTKVIRSLAGIQTQARFQSGGSFPTVSNRRIT